MFRSIFIILFFALSTVVRGSERPTPSLTARDGESLIVGQAEENLNGILYEITGNGLKQPSYLFGSIHVINGPSVFNFPHFREVWDKAERLVLETDLSAKADSISAERMKQIKISQLPKGLSSMYLPADSSFAAIIGEKAAHEIDSVMKSFSPRYNIAIHPAYGSLLLKAVIAQFMAERTANGRLIPIDGWLNDVAERAGKEIDSLESREFQENMSIATMLLNSKKQDEYATRPLKVQMMDFHDECMRAGVDGMHMKLVKDNYKNGNGRKAVEEILHVRAPEMSAVMQVDKRNARWMKKMPVFMSDKTTLFVVGLAHLYPFFESKGLVHDLIEAGYTLTPM